MEKQWATGERWGAPEVKSIGAQDDKAQERWYALEGKPTLQHGGPWKLGKGLGTQERSWKLLAAFTEEK